MKTRLILILITFCTTLLFVAEMTADGKIKGGSWNNTIDECTIDKTQSITLSSPYVGFRVVMEIIEK